MGIPIPGKDGLYIETGPIRCCHPSQASHWRACSPGGTSLMQITQGKAYMEVICNRQPNAEWWTVSVFEHFQESCANRRYHNLSCLDVYCTVLLVEYHVCVCGGGGGCAVLRCNGCRSVEITLDVCLKGSTDRAGKLFHLLIVLEAKENLNEEVFETSTQNLYLCLALVRLSAGVRPMEVASAPTCPWTTLNFNASQRSLRRSFSSCSPRSCNIWVTLEVVW